MKKFDDGNLIRFVNPDSDLFQQSNTEKNSSHVNALDYIRKNYPESSFDVIHIHFEYHYVNYDDFLEMLKYFKDKNKPIVWTMHDRRSNDIESINDLIYEKLLFEYADQIITLTNGCKDWILNKFGDHKRTIEVIAHGYIEDPSRILELKEGVLKNDDLFTILIGNFRANKDIFLPVANFLILDSMKNKKLRILCNPMPMHFDHSDIEENVKNFFFLTVNNPRVELVCRPYIEHDLITRTFLESHAVLLPYKWGTHSGQLELARDCGCHVIVPDVGFYKEQWDKVESFNISDGKKESYSIRFADVLASVSKKGSLGPDTEFRKREFNQILKMHHCIYLSLLNI